MSKSLNGLSSSRRPPDSLMMSFERADSWFEREKDKVWIQCNVKGAHFLFYLECISCIDGRFGESLDQDVSHVVHLQFKTLRAWMHLLDVICVGWKLGGIGQCPLWHMVSCHHHQHHHHHHHHHHLSNLTNGLLTSNIAHWIFKSRYACKREMLFWRV